MTRDKWSPAYRRYQWRTGLSMAAYVGILVAVDHAMQDLSIALPIRCGLALLPAICLVGVIVALARYISEESDEYLRHQVVLRILCATAGTLIVATVWGFLQVAGLPPVALYHATTIWFLFFAVASLVTRARAR